MLHVEITSFRSHSISTGGSPQQWGLIEANRGTRWRPRQRFHFRPTSPNRLTADPSSTKFFCFFGAVARRDALARNAKQFRRARPHIGPPRRRLASFDPILGARAAPGTKLAEPWSN